MSPFNELPDEIISHILTYLAPEETLTTIPRLSKRFYRIADTQLLWKFYCETSFRYWQSDHDIQKKLRNKATDVDWKALYTLRLRRNRRIAHLLDGIVASRVSRLQKTEEICQYGYDAKDFLLSQCKISEDADDVLARRFYSCNVLDSIHRSIAIEEWAKYQKHAARLDSDNMTDTERLRCGMKLERALGAFDMFVLHDNEGDMDEISVLLDHLIDQFRAAHQGVDSMTTRAKALALAAWLHRNNITGMENESETFRYLRNCLIGRALKDDQHPSLPIISAAIFSALAERIGVEAYCCALPSHVHAVVLSPEGYSLDGQPLGEDEEERQKMFLDPYGSDSEVPLEQLHAYLYRLGAHVGRDSMLVPNATDLIVMRTAQNIRASFTSFRTIERPMAELIPLIELRRGDWARNLQPALYSMIWASIMMVPVLPENEDVRWDWQQDVRDLINYFYEYFPEDAWLVERYVCPMYDTFSAPGRRQNAWELPSKRVRDQIKKIRQVDSSERAPRRRSDLTTPVPVKYRVGQVFKHKRYDYHGIILGWSVDGVSESMGWDGDNLGWSSSRTAQAFYRCMVGTDGSDHHVIAEDNMEMLDLSGGTKLPREIQDLVPMAGKFFRRYDEGQGAFVSNMRELFPED
ncbi:putative F-box domain-containing protein [Seiridium cardinale]|uniref:F-box domain-containing protein n=1 Tax=Seiridium cardinale TaxID=138064 RepID=A0ABR2XGA3_9PEZI